jgi:hypothetical protein
MQKALLFCALGLTALGLTAQVASAQINVYVGYADNDRPNPNFPNPWDGSPNTIYLGQVGGTIDAGAILLVNTGPSAVTLDPGDFVDGLANGSSPGPIWDSMIGSGISIPSGNNLILTQTTEFDFDTSDFTSGSPTESSPNPNQPVIHLFLNGTESDFTDTGQVLNSGGWDPGGIGENESAQWRLVGTLPYSNRGGNPPGVPEPGVVSMLGSGLLGLGGLALRRRSLRK